MTERDSIIARHKSAQPDPTANPAWANAHHDMARLIAIDDEREAQGTAVIVAQRQRIEELESALQAAIEDMRAHGIMGRGHPAEEAFRELQR